MNGSIMFRCNGAAAQQAVARVLERRGLRVMRSFDLQTARAAVGECSCPHHGTEHCSCEYFVLLVYGAGATPAVVTVHGQDARLSARLVEMPDSSVEPLLATEVELGLLEAAVAVAAATIQDFNVTARVSQAN